MKFSEEDLEAVCFEDDASFDYEIVEDFGWEDDGKYAHQTMIVKVDDKFYEMNFSRSGSYYTDYDYFFEDQNCPEVEQKEVLVKKWMRKEE